MDLILHHPHSQVGLPVTTVSPRLLIATPPLPITQSPGRRAEMSTAIWDPPNQTQLTTATRFPGRWVSEGGERGERGGKGGGGEGRGKRGSGRGRMRKRWGEREIGVRETDGGQAGENGVKGGRKRQGEGRG